MKKRTKSGVTKVDVLLAIVVGVLLLMLDFGRPWLAVGVLLFVMLAFTVLRSRRGWS
jgi:hypothetical protein